MTVSVFDYEGELSACAAGDRTAFEALYAHEAPAMLALGRAMLGERAEDLVHETFVLIWRNAAGYSPAIGTARAWIYSILRYRALAHLRQGPRPDPARPLPEPAKPRAHTRLTEALDRLPEGPRAALRLAYLHGLDYPQLAARLGGTEDAVRTETRRALAQLDQAILA
ncbi:sigma-70 family RNA polymerase sigma factor [Castellaniella sp. GW247-6E4]|uniref:RNA polymerase sigma factor n=1 Tax=Castellaniella sp. GW247-6E4 TaxID=3140380 RepID=UPI003315862F